MSVGWHTRFLQCTLALWAGSLWTVCVLVAPLLFAVLERSTAGLAAGQLFRAEAYVSALLGGLTAWFLAKVSAQRSDYVFASLGAIAPLLSEWLLQPLMSQARQAGDLVLFGALHGVAAFLFFVACLATGALFWRTTARSR